MTRYQRQVILPEVGEFGQAKLREARVLCVGIGGLGSPCALYLAAAGVGKIGIIDPDCVNISNLQRQILFSTSQQGQLKTTCAAKCLKDINPETALDIYSTTLTSENALTVIGDYDIVVDASDNFPTRFLINNASVKLGKPVIYGAVQGFEGQSSVFWAKHGPCYRCLFPRSLRSSIQNCTESGIIGALAGLIGTTQALETIKLIIGEKNPDIMPLIGQLWVIDTRSMSTSLYKIPKNERCPVCSLPPEEISLSQDEAISCSPCVEIDPEETSRLKDIIYIDVRELYEWQEGYIPKSYHIPLSELAHKELDPGNHYVIYCQNGGRSKKAVEILSEKGFPRVMSLRGGFKAWRARQG